MDANTAILNAKIGLTVKSPFFSTFTLNTPTSLRETGFLAATDGKEIYYSAEVATCPPPKVMGLLAHECMHIMLHHFCRCGWRDKRLWNMAADYAINWVLAEAKFDLPKGALLDDKYSGSAEENYDKLIQDGVSPPEDAPGDILPDDSITPADMARVLQVTAQAAAMARATGTLKGALERLVETALKSTVPWQDIFREYMTTCTAPADETWSRRNRRYEVILPAKLSRRLGMLGIIIDTSGSIGEQEVAEALGHVQGMAEVMFEHMCVMCADADITTTRLLDSGDDIQIDIVGGGGTDMRVPLAAMDTYEPDVVVMLTDGYTPWPSSDPNYPLIVLCTTSASVPIGRVIRTA